MSTNYKMPTPTTPSTCSSHKWRRLKQKDAMLRTAPLFPVVPTNQTDTPLQLTEATANEARALFSQHDSPVNDVHATNDIQFGFEQAPARFTQVADIWSPVKEAPPTQQASAQSLNPSLLQFASPNANDEDDDGNDDGDANNNDNNNHNGDNNDDDDDDGLLKNQLLE